MIAIAQYLYNIPKDTSFVNIKDVGTTWLKALTVTLPERSKNHPSSDVDHLLLYENPHGIVPALEIKVYHESSSPNLDKFSATPRLFSTHMRLHAMQENLRHFPCKIVYVYRNVKDTLISNSQGHKLCKYQGCWYYYNTLQGVLNFQSGFQPQATDIILASYPNSGTTWLKALTVTLPERSKNHPSSDADHLLLYENPHGIVPALEIKVYHESSSPNLDKFSATPRLFSTHMRLHAMQENLRHFPCKIVDTSLLLIPCKVERHRNAVAISFAIPSKCLANIFRCRHIAAKMHYHGPFQPLIPPNLPNLANLPSHSLEAHARSSWF
ncbi:hypothetical protein YC2023_051611 [Brassica napus]